MNKSTRFPIDTKLKFSALLEEIFTDNNLISADNIDIILQEDNASLFVYDLLIRDSSNLEQEIRNKNHIADYISNHIDSIDKTATIFLHIDYMLGNTSIQNKIYEAINNLDIYNPIDLISASRLIYDEKFHSEVTKTVLKKYGLKKILQATCISSLREEYRCCAMYCGLLRSVLNMKHSDENDDAFTLLNNLIKYLNAKTTTNKNGSIIQYELNFHNFIPNEQFL